MKSILLAFFQLLAVVCTAQLKGKVVAISDGDTFTLLTEEKKQVKVRLHGIDTPEHGQDFATAAQDYLGDLIFHELVEVEQRDIDRYGRTIGVVWLQRTNINEELLKAGLAWHYKYYDKNEQWAQFESLARQQRKGLWAKPNPMAPWDWRRAKRS